MGGKREGSNDESSHSKHKIKKTQVSIIKEKHSSYTTPTNQGWEEKEEGSNYESSHSKHKIKRHKFHHQRKAFKVHTTH